MPRSKPGAKGFSDGQLGDKSDGDYEPARGVPVELAEAVRRRVAEQLSPNSAFGRQLNRQLSDYFGEPVEIRTKTVALSGATSRRPARVSYKTI